MKENVRVRAKVPHKRKQIISLVDSVTVSLMSALLK